MQHVGYYALILLVSPAALPAQDDEKALAVAKETLNRGAELFDGRDAAAMAATYVEAAEIIAIKRETATGRVTVETRSGRPAIEKLYAELFKDRLPEHRCRNTVESARFLGRELLMIRGRFAMNVDQGDTVQFVQIRAREGERWNVVTMQVMELPE